MRTIKQLTAVKQFKTLSAAFLVGILMTFNASAALVEFKNISGVWVDDEPDAAVTGEGTSQIRWGNSTTQSGYDFVAGADTSVTVPPSPSAAFALGDFTHLNFPVSPPSLESVTLSVTLDILIDGIAAGASTFLYNFTHFETPNNGNPCAAGGAQPCPDLVSFSVSDASDSFLIGGVNYTVNILGFSTDGGTTITDSFLTLENQSNTATLFANVTTSNVSEPSLLALIGIVLAGVGFRKRMQR
ncbi:PEP-CTERM sorting domain-containing protein [Glaciecola sp. XM2]|jgi:hypothetical protein|uniref:THxN family PEP-CTERM protein n=1 Tax=Glaciecola sp. XM2 TaxID=1914931 RepID=UPI001BDE0D3E|nr:THxN family PEP-CTERM protein [Glaciecola sp. XM2]MBT1450553.1 PEP-CTERM sorting domain-containing protein [Glaciecola sp. XM2]